MITQNQQFDTIRLHIPEEAISKLDKSFYHIPFTANAQTLIASSKGSDVQTILTDIGEGLNYVKHSSSKKLYDIQISAKILRKDYWQGIQKNNIEKVVDTIEKRMHCEINTSQFIEQGKILKCDNTFNIPITNDIEDYMEALELLVVQGTKAKLDVYSDTNEKSLINSVVIGKNTSFLQKITFYNKLKEADAVCSKMPGIYAENIEKEYGMKYDDFVSYFNNKIRCELRVTKFDQLRKFYANNRKGDVYLQDILLSKNNAIDYQWNQFVKRKDTEIAIKAIDEMYTIKKLYSSDFKVAAYANLLKPLIDAYNGDVSKVKRDVKKIYYPDATKISDTIADTIVDLCATYKKTKMSKKNGSMFVNKLADNFKELEKQIKEI
jgi:hypothetical protein